MPALEPTVLTTSRLTLRWVTRDDAPAYFTMFSDPLVARYGSRPAWTEIGQAEEYLEQELANYRDNAALRLAIVLTETGEMIGNVSLYAFDDSNRRCDIGYALARAHWRRGYVTEALEALLDYGFTALNLNRVEADIDPRNTASENALQRLAFRKEGYLRERWIVGGEVCDTVFYGLLKSDWEQRERKSAAH